MDYQQDFSYQNLLSVRSSHRAADIAQSQALLLELDCSEPTLQQCFMIIESTCLSQGVFCQINWSDCTCVSRGTLTSTTSRFLRTPSGP